ncbi:uncharacterized protein DDB_G0283357-like [Panonychus citri]|uniref:uncharacterized protein DDB_G0283357-like n=1 Tax=Panonychus citri TaxID=50023 RepID=UPI00230786E3|nr:uncharacterized protein DDB_G0283357-like [Panonychus citri]
MDSFQMDYASDYEGSCGRSHGHHGHHSQIRSHHHQPRHHHHRGRSPSSATGRSTPGSESSNEQAKTRMRWILSLGLLLPALAAIIGVVAWAVSAEVVMGARRESAFKLSGPSRFHSNGHHDEFAIDRLDLKPGEAKNRISSSSSASSSSSSPSSSPSSSSISSTAHRNGMSKESRITESKLDDLNQSSQFKSSKVDDNRNANVYFLAGLESLNSEARPSFAGYRSPGEPNNSGNSKKSAGARVAEVIDRLVQQRKSEGSSPHIVVVAPLSDKSKKGSGSAQTTTSKPTTSTTTTTTPPPRNRYNDETGAFSRDADTLLAAAHLLARHSTASKRSDDEKGIFSIETSSSDEKPGFESANLIASTSTAGQSAESADSTAKETGTGQSGTTNVGANVNPSVNYHYNSAGINKHASYERQLNGQAHHGGRMMASSTQHLPVYVVSNRMGHGPMQGHYRSGPSHQHQQGQHHQQMMAAASQQNPTYVSSYGHQQYQGYQGDHQGQASSLHHHGHPHGHLQVPQGVQQQQAQQQQQQPGTQGYQMNHLGQQQQQQGPNGQQVGRDYQMAAESFPRPSFINNRDSYVAQESAPLLDFHASQVPEESGGYQESTPQKGLTFHFGGGPMGGGGQVMTSPLGIFKTLLLPLLPKPRVNLNGKVVFGVVLEKGVGYGKQKKHHPPPPPPPPPPHGFHHFGRRR